MAMVFIATGGSGGRKDPKKKDPAGEAEELSLAGLEEEAAKERERRIAEAVRAKVAELEAAYAERLQKAEEVLRKEYGRYSAGIEKQVEGLSQETRRRQMELDREHQKGGLLSSQVEEQKRRISALEKTLFDLESRLKERSAAAERSEGERNAARRALDLEAAKLEAERRKLSEAENQAQAAEKRAQAAERRTEAAETALAEAKKAPPASPKGGSAGSAEKGEPPREDSAPPGKEPASKAPQAVEPGRLQKRFEGLLRGAKSSENTTVRVVQLILEEAARTRASDIHLEPIELTMRVRFRVDGMLEEMLNIPDTRIVPVIQRVRVMCGLDPEQGLSTAKPQEGRMVVSTDGEDVDLRLSTFPTAYGDKAVLRLIYRGEKEPDLCELGFPRSTTKRLRRLIQRPKGMIILTGPAGSGKSTTLYTMLQSLNSSERNIVTLEDPVEMKIPGINQCTVHPDKGFTFADGLRSILRQDPNVIMVGEIRDRETAEIAMSASLTGHMLLTTLHTNSAAGAITRLLDMGLEPYLIASAVTAVFAQRLVRRICSECREEFVPEKAVLEDVRGMAAQAGFKTEAGSMRFSRGKGCPACRGTGYKGRQMLIELLSQFTGFRRLILSKSPFEDIQTAAVAAGMEPLAARGLRMVAEGETTLDEMFRVVGEQD